MINKAYLDSNFIYCPDTGLVTRRKKSGKIPAGTVVGSESKHGYLQVQIKYVSYRLHRVIWCMVYGEWPGKDELIDHINGNKLDNRISNLRKATHSEN